MTQNRSLYSQSSWLNALRRLDAFPKISEPFQARRRRSSNMWKRLFYAVPLVFIMLLWLSEFQRFGRGKLEYKFSVSEEVREEVQLNLDIVVATSCEHIDMSLVDRTGQAILLNGLLNMEAVNFDTTGSRSMTEKSHGEKDIDRIFMQNARPSTLTPKNTWNWSKQPACRIFGSFRTHFVSGELTIFSQAGFIDDISHVIRDFSFGRYYKNVERALSNVYGHSDENFCIFEYYVNAVETSYIGKVRSLSTFQYAANAFAKKSAVTSNILNGIRIYYDFDPLVLSVVKDSLPVRIILLRILSIVGGVLIGFELLNTTARALFNDKKMRQRYGLLEKETGSESD